MKKLVLYVMSFMVSQTYAQTSNNFEIPSNIKLENDLSLSYYKQFIENQNIAFQKANSETFLLDNISWTRPFGEKNYCLTPTMNNVKEYEKRIAAKNNKELNIFKSNFSFVKVDITESSIKLLSQVNIVVPEYVINKVICYLPQIDIDFLILNQVNIEILQDYGTEIKPQTKGQDRATTIWSEGFENSQVPSSNYNANNGSVNCGWGDVSCYQHSGNWSVWCAGNGPACNVCTDGNQDYVNDMSTSFYKSSYINTSGYSDIGFNFWRDLDLNNSGTNDLLKRYYNLGNGTWVLATTSTSASADDAALWKYYSVNYTGQSFTQYAFKFTFTSNWTGTSFGVYLDDIELTGTANGNSGVGIEGISINDNLKIYPNPTNGNFTLDIESLKSETIEINILNMAGELVFKDKVQISEGKNQKNIDSKYFSKGVYLVKIKTSKGVINKKLIIQ